MGDVVTRHGGQEADGAVDIGAVVFQRYLARFTYGLQDGHSQYWDFQRCFVTYTP